MPDTALSHDEPKSLCESEFIRDGGTFKIIVGFKWDSRMNSLPHKTVLPGMKAIGSLAAAVMFVQGLVRRFRNSA